jgi:hypothetical protein
VTPDGDRLEFRLATTKRAITFLLPSAKWFIILNRQIGKTPELLICTRAVQQHPSDAASNVCIYGIENWASISGRAMEFSLYRIHSNCRNQSPSYQMNA